ncbi:ABC transporter permease [Paenibacillus helianthi]|uniref:ABC transporter permease n=1 Tax=Paenibacillus helianthi TaxID=1349432 RepID=A0ABX3EST1_9BACL|nr:MULTISPECIES: sugar ABC transporter permease [Paenibacillus]OKP89790.1 ABC transporter permease [Paenibacillus sp. P32E]OKP90942.1 ABC transporter permease [Paenibacillus helianthi]
MVHIQNATEPALHGLASPVKKSRLALLWKEMKKSKHYYLMMSPYMIIFFLFTVIPVVVSLGLSFFYFNMLETPRFVGWENYSRLFLGDDVFMIALKNTFLFAVITGPLSYIACFLFAWLINELSPFVRALMTLVFYAPSISGNVFFIWLIVFSGDSYGYLNGFLMKIGVLLEPVQWLQNEKYVLAIVIIVQLWLSLGTSFLAFIAGLQTVDPSLFEAAAMDGIKNRWQELWFVTLPSMRPQLMFGAVMQITASFAVADVSIALAGFPSVNYAAHTVVTHLMDYGTLRFEMGYASAIATILFGIMLGTNMLTQKLLRKVGE